MANKYFFTIYKTTNLINGKFYIGAHKTKEINDQYLGSGKNLNRAIKKYGKNNFKKEILFIFDNEKEMFAKEKELVNEEFVNKVDTYNIKTGGHGSFSHITYEDRINIIKRRYSNPEKRLETSLKNKEMWANDEFKEKMKLCHKKRYYDPKEREKLSMAHKKRYIENPDIRKVLSKKFKHITTKRWQDPEFRKKLLKNNIFVKRKIAIGADCFYFESKKEACEALNIRHEILQRYIKAGIYKEYR